RARQLAQCPIQLRTLEVLQYAQHHRAAVASFDAVRQQVETIAALAALGLEIAEGGRHVRAMHVDAQRLERIGIPAGTRADLQHPRARRHFRGEPPERFGAGRRPAFHRGYVLARGALVVRDGATVVGAGVPWHRRTSSKAARPQAYTEANSRRDRQPDVTLDRRLAAHALLFVDCTTAPATTPGPACSATSPRPC